MIPCNDPRKMCGELVSSACVPYQGTKPDFIQDSDWPCDVNATDVIQMATDEIDEILDDSDLTGLNKRCLTFDPATITTKGLHQVEIDKICALDASVTTLQTTLNNLNIDTELVNVNLGAMTPITNPCSATVNVYTLHYILQAFANELNLIKTTLSI